MTWPGLLTLLFVYLKLTNQITWSWLWVVAPMWMPLAVLLPVIVVYAIVLALQPPRPPPCIRP